MHNWNTYSTNTFTVFKHAQLKQMQHQHVRSVEACTPTAPQYIERLTETPTAPLGLRAAAPHDPGSKSNHCVPCKLHNSLEHVKTSQFKALARFGPHFPKSGRVGPIRPLNDPGATRSDTGATLERHWSDTGATRSDTGATLERHWSDTWAINGRVGGSAHDLGPKPSLSGPQLPSPHCSITSTRIGVNVANDPLDTDRL